MELMAIASKLADIYSQNNKVDAVLLGGSVSRGWHDNHSDIELFILWREAPTDRDRMRVIEKVDGQVISFHPYEDEEWSESYITGGIKLEISGFLTKTIEQVINRVIVRLDTRADQQCLVAAVHHGVSIHGEPLIRELKNRVKYYPEELSEVMILEHVELSGRWNNRKALLDREDWLMFYQVLVSVELKVMGMLFGLNHMYVHHPAFKWQHKTLASMDRTPDNIAKRLDDVLLIPPEQGLAELEAIVVETYQLIEDAYPDHCGFHRIKEKALITRPTQ